MNAFRLNQTLFLCLLCTTLFVTSAMQAVDLMLNEWNRGKPERVNFYYAVSFAAYTLKPLFALVADLLKQRVSKGQFASFGLCVSASMQVVLGSAMGIGEEWAVVVGVVGTVGVASAYAALDGVLVTMVKSRAAVGGGGVHRRLEVIPVVVGSSGDEADDAARRIEDGVDDDEQNRADREVLENGGKVMTTTQASVQTLAMGCRTFAAILGSVVSVVSLEMVSVRWTITLSSIFAFVAAILALRIRERDEEEDLLVTERTVNRTIVAAPASLREQHREQQQNEHHRHHYEHRIRQQSWPWRNFFRDREFIALAMALFLYRITPTAMDTYNSFIYAIYEKRLPNSAFGMLQFFSNVGALFGAFAFSFFHNAYIVPKKKMKDQNSNNTNNNNNKEREEQMQLKTPRSKMNVFLLGGCVDVLFQLVRQIVIYNPPKVSDGGLRTAILLSILEFIVAFGSRFAYMPIVILSAVTAEKCENKEAFSFSTLVFFADVSSIFAGFISGYIVRNWKIGSSTERKLDMMYITGRSWHPLKNFVYLCAFSKAIALFVTLLLLKFALLRNKSGAVDTITNEFTNTAPSNDYSINDVHRIEVEETIDNDDDDDLAPYRV